MTTYLRDLAEYMVCEMCQGKGAVSYSRKWDVVYCTCPKGTFLFITRVSILRRIGWMVMPDVLRL